MAAEPDNSSRRPDDVGDAPAGGNVLLTINGGSSSIKFAAYASADPPRRLFGGIVDRIGFDDATLTAHDADGGEPEVQRVEAADHHGAAMQLIAYLDQRLGKARIAGVGHRVVHGGIHLHEHQLVTAELIAELKRTQPLDLAHLPREIALIEAFHGAFDGLPQVACFDTAFHHDLPRVARILPIPRRYTDAGVRKFGFHGLSFAYLMRKLKQVAGNEAGNGRVILAHLGSGASMAAVRGGRPVDTTMSFTPTAGLVMGTRPGDLDPGLLVYMMRVEKLTAEEMDQFISRNCGLRGISGSSADMRDLYARRSSDPRAGEAIEAFCYSARKWIGALAAALEGLDTLVFSGGIGEHSPETRAEICRGLSFLGIELDPARNSASAEVISAAGAGVAARVIPTDEESMIASAIRRVLDEETTEKGKEHG